MKLQPSDAIGKLANSPVASGAASGPGGIARSRPPRKILFMNDQAPGTVRPQRVHIYSESIAPAPNTNGAGLVISSQVQAFLDLGCEVEFVYLQTKDDLSPSISNHFRQITYTVVDARKEKPSRSARLAYWVGWPKDLALRQLFPTRTLLLREVKRRIQNDGTAIHVFNCMRTGNVIPSLPRVRAIWACHEFESEFHALRSAINQEIEKRRPQAWEKRLMRRLAELERKVAEASGFVLCVASAEARRIVEEWSVAHAAYLPFSVGNGNQPVLAGKHANPGELRLLHVGYLEHTPTYTSLEFLLTRVFPLLDDGTLSRLKLEIAGESSAQGTWTKAIMEMARPYPMVRFSGFVDEIRTAYGRNDLQVVASTRATGIRTRIIESWAFGTPVLSTAAGAGGVEALEPGRNILIADDPREFACYLQELVQAPGRLDEIAAAGRQTYEDKYGRSAVAGVLQELLNSHFGPQLPLASALAECSQKFSAVP